MVKIKFTRQEVRCFIAEKKIALTESAEKYLDVFPIEPDSILEINPNTITLHTHYPISRYALIIHKNGTCTFQCEVVHENQNNPRKK